MVDPLGSPPPVEAAPEDEEATSHNNEGNDGQEEDVPPESGFCDQDGRAVAKVMVPVVLLVILCVTLGLVFGGAFRGGGKGSSEDVQKALLRDIIGSTRANGQLLYEETWNATQDPTSPQGMAYEFLLNDATTKELLDKDIAEITRADYLRVRQRFALASFFFSLGGNTWKEKSGWLDGNVHECDWNTTYDGEETVCVPALDDALTYRNLWLENNNLTGPISHEFFDFMVSLKAVRLSSNQINGTLDELIGPRGSPRLSLKDLRLQHNNLSGSMNKFLKYFNNLETLWLQHNEITGTISPEIGTMDSLHKLALSFNSLFGTLPSQLGLLTGGGDEKTTTELYLDNNRLTGSIPKELSNLGEKLQLLWLHDNKLSSSIPTDLFLAYKLQELDLSNNRLVGRIGSEIANLQDLQAFRAANNSLSGTIPSQIADCFNLQYLDLRGNPNITGSIPDSLCSISSLEVDCTNLCGCDCGSCPNTSETETEAIATTNSSTTTEASSELQTNDDVTSSNASSAVNDRGTHNVCYFVLAGQSNVLGYADLGHLEEIVQEEPYASRYVNENMELTVLLDVFVTFDNEYGDFRRTQEGPLTATDFGTRRHFGPEVGFGFEMADLAIANGVCVSIVLVKAAGVAALANEWNAPNGEFFEEMIADVEDAMERKDEIIGSSGRSDDDANNNSTTAVLAGLVWFHGYADVYEPDFLAQYGDNLETWIKETRQHFSQPKLPIVIGQMGGQGLEDVDDQELEMRAIQANTVAKFDSATTALTNTSQFVTGFNASNETEVYDAHFHYYGRADVIINVGEQLARDMWSIMV